MSLNHDVNGIEFVSTIEHVKYPFYGVQFHPEKSLYEFVNAKVPHTNSAAKSTQYFADFFISEARQNPHRFLNATEQKRSLIYNYNPKYTSLVGSSFIQLYLFNFDVDGGYGDDDDSPYPQPFPYPPRGGGASSQSVVADTVVACAVGALIASRQL